MLPRKRSALALLVFALLVGCAKAPPILSPAATRAFYGTQVIHDLDRLREVVVAAHETKPPLVTADETLAVVQWHQTAIAAVITGVAGWKDVVITGLDQVLKRLNPNAQRVVAPYVLIIRTIVQEIP
jgi:type IV pilus biogenesis protein CpaD/CtpE